MGKDKGSHGQPFTGNGVAMDSATKTALAVLSPIELEVQSLIEETKSLAIADFSDQEGHDKVHAGLMKHVDLRVRANKLAKELRDPLNAAVKAIIAKEKEVLEPQGVEEERLKSMRDAYRAEQERVRKEAEELQEKRIQGMTAQLFDLGLTFNGERYVLQHEDEIFDITDVGIRLCDDADWARHIARINEMKADIHAAEQKAAKLKAEAEENERKRQEQIAAKEAEQKRKEEELARREAKLKEDMLARRRTELAPFIVFIRDYNGLLNAEDDAYANEFRDIKLAAEAQRLADERDRLKAEEEAKVKAKKDADDAAQAEIERVKKEAQDKIDAAEKATADALEAAERAKLEEQAAAEQEAQRIAEAQALLSHKQLIIEWIDAITIHPIGAEKFTDAEVEACYLIFNKFEGFKDWARKQAEKLA